MYERIATWFVEFLLVYVGVGAVFAVAFITAGVERIDRNARGSSILFRLLIFPGSAAFWPMLLRRWIRGERDVPEERNPHR